MNRGDWTNWDDAYQFMEDGNPNFVKSNLTNETFAQMQVNLIAFIQPSGKIVYQKAFNFLDNTPVPVPATFQAYLLDPSKRDLFTQFPDPQAAVTGILPLPEGPLLVAMRPILTSTGEGPSHGTLLFGRYLDDHKIADLAEFTQHILSSNTFNDPAMPDDFRRARSHLLEGNSIFMQPLTETSLAAYALLPDVFGQPVVILRLEQPKDIYQQGHDTIQYFILWMVGFGLVSGFVIQFTVTRWHTSHQAELSSELKLQNEQERAKQEIESLARFPSENPNPVLRITTDGTRLYTNPAAEMLLGSTAMYPQVPLEWRTALAAVRACQRHNEIEQEIKGKVFFWRIVPIPERGYLNVYGLDITERKRAEEAYQQSEAHYRSVIEQSAEGIYLVDIGTRCLLEANASFRELLGYSSEEIPGLRIYDLIQADPEHIIEDLCEIINTKRSAMGEHNYRRKDGSVVITSSNASLVSYGNREVISVVVRDLTLQKQAETEREQRFHVEQMRREELSVLYTLSRQMADTLDGETILKQVVGSAVDTIHTTFARILLLEEAELVVQATFPVRALGRHMDNGSREPVANVPLCQKIMQHNEAVLVPWDDPRLGSSERALLLGDLVKWLCLVPLRVGNHPIGLLVLGEARSEERERFTPEKIYLAQSIGDQAASALQRAQLFGELERSYLQTVLALARAVEAKDTYTADHAERLSELALEIGKELGMSPREIEDLRYGAVLHDIGKIGVPDAVLKKPAKLDAEDWKLMRQHPIIGAQILDPVPRLAGAARIVRHHHERYDGKGYPNGLKGEEIPLGARILTVVDSYSAIIDQRVYKAARPQEEALEELRKNAGTQFDPQVVRIFLESIPQEPHSLIQVEKTSSSIVQ